MAMNRDCLNQCLHCGSTLPPPNKFRAAIYCSGACRTAAHRHRMLYSAIGEPDAPITPGPWVESLDSLVAAVASGEAPAFGTIYADPPWAYNNRATRNSDARQYPTMSIAELCAMPVEKPLDQNPFCGCGQPLFFEMRQRR